MTSLRLGDVVTIERGTTYKSALIGEPGPVLLGLGTIQRNGGFRDDSLRTYGGDSPERLLVQPGQLYASLKDVTLSSNLLGAVARLPINHLPGRLTQDTVRLDIVDQRIPPKYLYWVLRTPQYRRYCRAHLTGTTNLGLPREDFFAFEFPTPTNQLMNLASLLDALDDKIESNRRTQKIGQSLLRSLIEAHIASSLGADGTFADYCDLIKVPARVSDLRGDENYIGLEHMPRGSIFLDRWDSADGLGSNKSYFRTGDILFGKLRPYFRKVGIAPIDGVCSTDVLVLRPKKAIDTALVATVASSGSLIDSVSAAATGTRMPRASWKDIAAWPVPVLSGSERASLASVTTPLLDRLAALTHEIHRLSALRDALLPELLSGRLHASAEKVAA